jgi:hypothetical protein
LRQFAGLVLDRYDDIDSVCAAPQQANPGSWRALENAGFAARLGRTAELRRPE